MKYRTAVKKNGRYYDAGVEVPEEPIAAEQGVEMPHEPPVKTETEVEAESLIAGSEQLLPLASMSLEELKAYAEENCVDIGRATTEDGVRKKIEEAEGR